MRENLLYRKSLNIHYIVYSIFIILAIPIGIIILCWISGGSIINLDISKWWISDEFSYYKQIEAMVNHFSPAGYFGYNEMVARKGNFGAWNFLTFLPYVLWGKIFGWNLYSPLISNLFFIEFAIIFLLIYFKPTKQQIIELGVCFLLFFYISRYTISCMVEPFFFSVIIIIMSFLASYIKFEKIEKIWVVYFMILYLSVLRPYFVLLFLFPIFLLYNKKFIEKKRKKCILLLSFSFIFASLILYYFMRYWFCSQYFSEFAIDWKWIVLNEGICGVINAILINLVGCSQEIWRLCLSENLYGDNYAYALFFILSIVLIVQMISYCFQKKKEYFSVCFFLLFIMFMLYMSIILFYHVSNGARHTMSFSLITIISFILLIQSDKWIKKFFFVVLFLLLVTYFPWKNSRNWIPFSSHAEMLYESKMRADMNKMISLDKQKWNNTIDVSIYDVDLHVTYELPSYVGIQLLSKDFEDTCSIYDLKAKYLIVKPESDFERKIKPRYYEIYLDTNEKFALYQRKRD